MLRNNKYFKFSSKTLQDFIKPKDHVLTGSSASEKFRFTFVDNSKAFQSSLENFNLRAENSVLLLGKCFTTSLLLSSHLQENEKIKCAINFPSLSEGKELIAESMCRGSNINELYAESTSSGEVRGYYKQFERPLGYHQGPFLHISRSTFNQRDQAFNVINLQTDENSNLTYTHKDLERFFMSSEQVMTRISLNCFKTKSDPEKYVSNGFLVQKISGCKDNQLQTIFDHINNSVQWKSIQKGEKSMITSDILAILEEIDPHIDIRRYPVEFTCRCKKDDFVQLLKGEDKKTIQDMKEKKQNDIHCSYCNKMHSLEKKDYDFLLQYS